MLKKRIIPCLDIRNGQVTKGIEFKNNINLGDPAPLALRYAEQGADEIVIYDITASSEKRPPDFATLEKIARQVFIPICVGGGISSFQHAAQCIKSGAEKISLNSIAPKNPQLISEIASHFGVQAVVLSIDVAQDTSAPSGYRIYTHGGRTPTHLDALDWVRTAIPLGVGELCVNSINQDGKTAGYDLNLLRKIRMAVQIPVIISGGAGEIQHFQQALLAGADAVLVASILHNGKYTVHQIKQELLALGYPMRMDF